MKQHLKGVWSHTNLSLDLVALHQEILINTQNSKLPIIQPSDVATRVLDALKDLTYLRHSFWIMLKKAFLILLILCLFPVMAELACTSSSN
jgi:hypothetical protein